MEEHIAESALEPSTKDYYSLTEKMVDQGLGIPTKRQESILLRNTCSEFFSSVSVVWLTLLDTKPQTTH